MKPPNNTIIDIFNFRRRRGWRRRYFLDCSVLCFLYASVSVLFSLLFSAFVCLFLAARVSCLCLSLFIFLSLRSMVRWLYLRFFDLLLLWSCYTVPTQTCTLTLGCISLEEHKESSACRLFVLLKDDFSSRALLDDPRERSSVTKTRPYRCETFLVDPLLIFRLDHTTERRF